MNITIVHGSNDTYGASRVLVQEIKCLLSLGHSVRLLLPSDGPLNELASFGGQVEISVIPDLLVLRRSSFKDAVRVPRLPDAMKSADVVVLWTLGVAAYIPILRFWRKKFYVSVHELLEDWIAGRIFSLLMRGAFPVTACSHATARWLGSIGVREARIAVTYPVFELGDLDAGPDTNRPETDQDEFTVAVIGRVNGHKGHLEVARALQEPELSGAPWKLVLAGAPFDGQENALEELMAVSHFDPRITYLGQIASLEDLGPSVDIVALFPTKPEPFGLVPLEAWARGIRSVGYGDGGAGEVLPLVGGTVVRRSSSPIKTIAEALSNELKRRNDNVPLPSRNEVLEKLSSARRIATLSTLLTKMFGDEIAASCNSMEAAPWTGGHTKDG